MASLKQKTVKGVLWSSVERFSVQIVLFVVTVVMARLLTPEDYGLVGMLAIFMAVAQSLIDSGFSQALIRKQDRTETDNSTVFYFNIAVGFILYIILFLSASFVARFYNTSLLCPVMRVLCLSVVINSLVVVQRALLTAKVNFKTQAKATLIAALLSGVVGIVLAYKHFGVWALVAQQLTNYGTTAVLLWIFSKWRPSLLYSWQSFKELFAFGSKLLASGLLDTLWRNIYLIVIGKTFSANTLGHYTKAHEFASFPSSNITGIMQRVTYPVLCEIQNEDERLSDVYRRFLRLSAFIVFPLMCGLAALAKPVILILLGEKWEFCATLLQIMCFAMMWYPIHSINLNLLQVKGRSDLFLRLEIIKKIIGIVILVITLPLGLKALCFGQIVSSIISLIINTHYTGKLIHIGFLIQMKDLSHTLILSLTMFTAVFFALKLFPNVYLQLIIGVLIGCLIYFSVSYLCKFNELKEIKNIFPKQ